MTTITTVEPKGPLEKIPLTFDFTDELAGATINSIVGSPYVIVLRGNDPNYLSVISTPQQNASAFTFTFKNGTTKSIPANSCVQAWGQNGVRGCWYQIEVTVVTTDGRDLTGRMKMAVE